MSDLSIAVVGCGALGQVHLTVWMNLIGVRVRAVIDKNASLAVQTVTPYVGIPVFPDLQTALASEGFDLVDVCLPPNEQQPIIEMALNAGCHVLCEKPITYTSATARPLLELANQRERLLIPGFVHRFYAPLLHLKECIDNDDIGRPTMFRCRFSGHWEEAGADRMGDILTETATNGIDLFRYLCGEVASSHGYTRKIDVNIGIPDTALITLEGVGGALGVVEACWTSPGGHNRVEVYGSAGAAIVDYDSETLRILTAEHPIWQTRYEAGPNRYERLLSHCTDALRGLQEPIVCALDALRALEICESVSKA